MGKETRDVVLMRVDFIYHMEIFRDIIANIVQVLTARDRFEELISILLFNPQKNYEIRITIILILYIKILRLKELLLAQKQKNKRG